MGKPDLRVVSCTDAATVDRNVTAKGYALVQDLLEAENFEEWDRACRAFLAYLEPGSHLTPVSVRRDGRDDGQA